MADTGRIRVGDFEILAKIGEGSLGTVFKAVCLADGPAPLSRGMVVALKRLHPSADFPRETRALAALDHPNIVRFLGFFVARPGEWDEAPILVTELLEGADLAARLLHQPEGLPWEEARAILDQVLAALEYAETRGVVHRDLKPSNLFLCRDGTVKVIDFGLARKEGGTVSSAGTRAGLTGTLDYMAPEYARVDGFRGDVASDVFSFGVLACQLVTGLLPFPPLGEHPEIAFIRRWTGSTPPRASVPRAVTYAWDGVAAFLARALQLDREARYPSFHATREALASVRPRRLEGLGTVFTLEAFVASGGFCDVYRARSDRGEAVAVKRLHAGRHEWRFRREAGLLEALRELEHPALLRVHGLIEEPGPDGAPCLVMEYLPGADLRRRLAGVWETGGGLPWTEVVPLFIHYLEGLEALHANGIAHRDIKPANLYAPEGRPEEGKVLDLGVACEQDGTVTTHGLPPGTLDYMAPELTREGGGRGTPQSDLFALGCSLYEALTGRPAFGRLPEEDAAALRALCARCASGSALAHAFAGFDVPVFGRQPGLAAVVEEALRFDPADRPGGREEAGGRWTGAGARAMRMALRAVLEGAAPEGPAAPPTAGGEPPAAPPTTGAAGTADPAPTPDPAATVVPSPPSPRRPPVRVILLTALGLAAAAFGLRSCSSSSAPDPAPPPVPAEPAALAAVAAPLTPGEPSPGPSAPADPEPAKEPVPPAPEPAAEPARPEPEAPRIVIRPPARPVAPEPPGPVPVVPPADPVAVPAPAAVKPPAAAEPAPVVKVPTVSEADLAEAEKAVRPWLVWLTRLDDPLLSATLRRFQPGAVKPGWAADLPFLLQDEKEALPPAIRNRYERLLAWEQAAADLAARRDTAPRVAVLRTLAGREAEPARAARLRFEAAVLEWRGGAVDEAAFTGVPEATFWRLHVEAAAGDDQDAGRILRELAGETARREGGLEAEDALLAVRAADAVLRSIVGEIRDKTAPEVTEPGTGRTTRDPVKAYAAAVERFREAAAETVRHVLAAARATGPAAAAAVKAQVEADRTAPGAAGDRVWSLPELDGTPWAGARAGWADRLAVADGEERRILAHVLGREPLPAEPAGLPVARLRDAGKR